MLLSLQCIDSEMCIIFYMFYGGYKLNFFSQTRIKKNPIYFQPELPRRWGMKNTSTPLSVEI